MVPHTVQGVQQNPAQAVEQRPPMTPMRVDAAIANAIGHQHMRGLMHSVAGNQKPLPAATFERAQRARNQMQLILADKPRMQAAQQRQQERKAESIRQARAQQSEAQQAAAQLHTAAQQVEAERPREAHFAGAAQERPARRETEAEEERMHVEREPLVYSWQTDDPE
ncbi:MAG: hypothetical protein CMJ59_06835 [Planctomycetaceae bacterium]|nr:hypothetical protein [Planctomycetaceae bacterium]